jgi:hypothetical protein
MLLVVVWYLLHDLCTRRILLEREGKGDPIGRLGCCLLYNRPFRKDTQRKTCYRITGNAENKTQTSFTREKRQMLEKRLDRV